jgi:hypothetical protein
MVLVSVLYAVFNHLNAELSPIFHLLALLGAHYILHVSRIRVNMLIVTRAFKLFLPSMGKTAVACPKSS